MEEEEEDDKMTRKGYSGKGKKEWIGKSHGSYKEERRGMEREERGRKSRRG